MENNTKLFSIIVVLLLIFGALYYFLQVSQPKPKYHQALKLSLSQLANNELSLKELKLESTYSEAAKNDPKVTAYYQAKILARNNKVLYTTQVPKEYLFTAFTYAGYEALPPMPVINSEIELYLPVYENAEKATIEDEAGNTIMSINLKSLSAESPNNHTDLCGNSICDLGENRSNCDADCQ
jgi:hypothetical protein